MTFVAYLLIVAGVLMLAISMLGFTGKLDTKILKHKRSYGYSPMGTYCGQCGTRINPQVAFCPNCGSKR